MIAPEEYGKALWGLAEACGGQERYLQNLEQMEQAFRANPGYASLLDTPAIPKEERFALIDRAFAGAEPDCLNFLKLLCERHAIYRLGACVSEYRKLYYEANGISRALCVSAVPLSQEQKDSLVRLLQERTEKTILLECRTDPSLIGGMVLRVDGKQLDGSVRARLEAFRSRVSDVIL
ncbi:MAG: ATP synthase F1 subunit delta [Candidatus Methanomethylophilaceae archaeon]|nr:ATP synthase F1 subunit delta [Candidatus Methanomethylophilaceae archaeon]